MKPALLRFLIPTLAWLCSLSAAQAALIVYEDVTPNLAWPDTPVAASAANPQISGTGIGAGGNTLAQTFVAPSSFTLRAVALAYWTTSDNTGDTLTLGLYAVTSPQGINYTPTGPNLLGGGAGLSFTPTVVTGGSGSDEDLIIFEFTGTDAVALTSGQSYAFQIQGSAGLSFSWPREGSGGSLGGEGYINGLQLSPANGARDLKMALYDTSPIPEPSAALATMLGAGLLLSFRRRRR